MSDQKYVIVRDEFNRLRTEITDSFAVSVKLLAEDHPRRVEQHVHAYVVADLRVSVLPGTELVPWRIRDIRVMWSPDTERYFVRYRQWPAGKTRATTERWLDVAGPLDRETRAQVQEAILSVFFQIKEEAKQGVLGKLPVEGNPPEITAKLESLESELVQETDLNTDAS